MKSYLSLQEKVKSDELLVMSYGYLKKFRKFIFFLFIVHHSSFIIAKAQILSPNAKISLLTVSPGQAVYSTYGHSALWVSDPENGINLVYNYGAFNFRTPNFYVKFLRGQLPYQVVADAFENNIYQWQAENRLVTEQILNLSLKQKRNLYHRLAINALPQNSYYSYRFFFDNCSTRLRDMVQRVSADSLRFSENLNTGKSYRQWIDKYTRPTKAWIDFGMDLALGEPSDSIATAQGAMFLPDNLMMAFDSATVSINGKTQPLVLLKRDVSYIMPDNTANNAKQPIYVFWAFCLLGLAYTFWQYKRNNKNRAFDIILFSIVGLAGFLLAFLWFGTDHGVMNNNFNLIWAFPLLFPIVFFRSRNQKIMLVYGIAQGLLLLVWVFLPQEMNPAVLPLVILLGVRALKIFYR